MKRGSTCRIVAPRSRARITKRNPTGCASAKFDPMIRMQSAFARSIWNVVAPPLPIGTPRPGTVAECHIRAWFSTWTIPAPTQNFLIR